MISVILIWLGLVAVLGLASPALSVDGFSEWSAAAVAAAGAKIAPPVPTYPALAPAPAAAKILPPPAGARAFLVGWWDTVGNQTQVLAAKNAETPLPLASVTKLMTAALVPPEEWGEVVVVPPAALVEMPAASALRAGESFRVGDLVRALLVESNNQAAETLAARYPNFVDLLNERARTLGLQSARFTNVSGLDPVLPDRALNEASAEDLFRLAVWILAERPELWRITQESTAPLYLANGPFHHEMKNTNELLAQTGWAPGAVVGGKTGYTTLARKNLLMVFKLPESRGYLVAVVLGAEDNFVAMRELMAWARASYKLE